MIHSSLMAAVTTPSRFGFTIVDIFFGEVRPRRNQTVAMKGDYLMDDSGQVFLFEGREGDTLHLEPIA